MMHPVTSPVHGAPFVTWGAQLSVNARIGCRSATALQAHRAPVPEDEPLPGEEPAPEDEPTPHPDPVVREPDDAPPLRLSRRRLAVN